MTETPTTSPSPDQKPENKPQTPALKHVRDMTPAEIKKAIHDYENTIRRR